MLDHEISPPDTLHIHVQRRPAVERDTTVQDWGGGGGGESNPSAGREGGR